VTRVLYVDADRDFAATMSAQLAAGGLEVTHVLAPDFDQLPANDVVLLDPGGADPVTVCQRIRARSAVPLVLTSPRDDLADRVLGLEAGADDFVVKPCAIRELIARLRAQARRNAKPQPCALGGLVIDQAALAVTLNGRSIRLSAHELAVLHLLAQRADRVVTRAELLRGARTTARSIDVTIFRIRAKLAPDRSLQTVRGVGYLLSSRID